MPQNRWYASVFYDLGGLDAGATVHFVGQMSDTSDPARKIREWTTLDLVVNYTFHLPQPVTEPVPGYAKDRGNNAEMKDGEDKERHASLYRGLQFRVGGADGSIIPPSRSA